MSSICSIASRAVWAFIILAGALVLVIATTDHPLVWRLMSLPGLLVMAVVSFWVGWVLRPRRAQAPAERAPAPDPAKPEAALAAPSPEMNPAPEPEAAPVHRAPETPRLRPVTEPLTERREPAIGAKPKQIRTPLPEPRQPVARPAPRIVAEARSAAPRLTRDVPEPPRPANGLAMQSDAARVLHAFRPDPVAPARDEGPYRRPAPTGDAAVDACFDISDFEDAAETRGAAEIPELPEAEALLEAEDRAQALTRLGEILALYPDYAPLYLWLAGLLHEAGRPDARDMILEKGLATARAKAEILAAIGDYAVYEGRMADAVPWLVRAAALQLGGGASAAPQAFSLLSGLCDPHASLARTRLWLQRELEERDTDKQFRLDEVAKGRLHLLSKTQSEGWMRTALERLWRFYSDAAPAAPTEQQVLLLKPRNSPSPAEHHHRPQALQ